MVPRILASLLAFLLGGLALNSDVRADGTLFPGARPLGSGGAMRAVATGDAGPMLNPSGISLMRAYAVESGYQYGKTAGSQDMRLSAVDSTSGFNLGGALYYTYHRETPADGVTRTNHLAGGSLSFPIVEKIFVGGNVKWVRFRDAADATHSAFTFDAGMTVRPIPQISIAAVGYNLRDLGTPWTPRGAGGGVAFIPMPTLLFAFDTVWTKVYGDPTRDQALQYMGGGELSFAASAAIRAGGGYDGVTRNGYASGGLTWLSPEMGAIDFGLRQDVSGVERTTIVGVSVRLFIPSM